MAAKILAVALLFLGLAHAVPQKPCPNNDIPCISKFISKYAKCDASDNKNLQSVSAKQVFDAPFFKVHVERQVTIKGLDKASVKGFSYDEATGVATLETLIPAYSAEGWVLMTVKDAQGKPHSANSTLSETLPSFVLTTVFKGPKKIDLADSTSSIPKDAVPTYTNLSYLKHLEDPVIAALAKSLQENRPQANAATNAARAKTLSEIVFNKIIC